MPRTLHATREALRTAERLLARTQPHTRAYWRLSQRVQRLYAHALVVAL
ncbi:hypothetical protein GO986_16365 [Deinococcus sp. HMF7620]|uniref:Uncharacterized protein n=1 Tax=Deinococcus arboris TaxID=2682977 RepID=A0A7C9LSN5_9DEIO|nr:hypothetical protein [Deinococcus arboris]MVN88321.1 hypothetical protein [Deinococcus arboris]